MRIFLKNASFMKKSINATNKHAQQRIDRGRVGTYLSFSVPKIEAKRSAIYLSIQTKV